MLLALKENPNPAIVTTFYVPAPTCTPEATTATVPSRLLQGTVPARSRPSGFYSPPRAEVNASTGRGISPLHLAVRSHSPELVELLLTSGAEVNDADPSGWTALHVAGVSSPATIQRLLAAGADVVTSTSAGQTPLMTLAPHVSMRP